MYLDDNLWTRPNHVPLAIVYAVDRGGEGGRKTSIGLTLDGLANTSYGLDSSLWSYMNQFSKSFELERQHASACGDHGTPTRPRGHAVHGNGALSLGNGICSMPFQR
jgi:hypothetical protein